MKCILLISAVWLGLTASSFASEPTTDKIQDAVAKALPLIQKGAAGHIANGTCFACHNQGLPILAMTTARARGFKLNEEELQTHLKFIAGFLDKNRANYQKGRGQGGQADTAGYALWTLEMGGWKGNLTTDAVAEFFLLYNKDADHWKPVSNRPPSEASHFTTTYLGLRAVQTFGTDEQKERLVERTKSVCAWLSKAPAKDTEDRVFRLWAMKRAGVDGTEIQAAAQELIKTQLPEGGWAQLDTMKPDAYATGAALVALHETGELTTKDAAYRRGIAFLLDTQHPDGSWHVRSRSKPFQTYFESGFPHGKDQFISLAASSWATTALALSLPVAKNR